MAREPHKTNLIDLPHELLQSITSELKIKDIFKLAICSTISRLSVLDICQTKVARLSLKLKEEQVCANCFPGVTMSQQRKFIPGDFFPFIRPQKITSSVYKTEASVAPRCGESVSHFPMSTDPKLGYESRKFALLNCNTTCGRACCESVLWYHYIRKAGRA